MSPETGGPAPNGASAAPALSRPVPLGVLAAGVLVICALDWVTPAGVVVGALLAIPIVLASTRATPREVVGVAGLAAAAFAIAAVFGRPSPTPAAFWIPNRVMAALTIPAAAGVALLLQRHRLRAERARDAAVGARDLNRVLMSLLAHDLRAPLVVARQCIGYVEDGLADGRAPDPGLLADTRARLDRSIRAIEIVLSVARAEVGGAGEDGARPVRLADELRAEVESFAGEAALRGKRLELRLDGLSAAQPVLNPLVLRQAMAILVDNAIRYAVPGVVTVSAQLRDGALRVTVADGGPARPGDGGELLSRGAGLGLELSRALLAHAGGGLERDPSAGGSAWTLRLPVARAGKRGRS
ncbi:MAG TPA: HAMP domain-containing sensor histidine kinase [Longimicrobium sp.]|nr:HAMP domain-containing sensor histidine kinase [Longimicrobium sp.]